GQLYWVYLYPSFPWRPAAVGAASSSSLFVKCDVYLSKGGNSIPVNGVITSTCTHPCSAPTTSPTIGGYCTAKKCLTNKNTISGIALTHPQLANGCRGGAGH
ncbi:unnamed protein product, partial [Discosporangium mesarthrocarpum]